MGPTRSQPHRRTGWNRRSLCSKGRGRLGVSVFLWCWTGIQSMRFSMPGKQDPFNVTQTWLDLNDFEYDDLIVVDRPQSKAPGESLQNPFQFHPQREHCCYSQSCTSRTLGLVEICLWHKLPVHIDYQTIIVIGLRECFHAQHSTLAASCKGWNQLVPKRYKVLCRFALHELNFRYFRKPKERK